MAEPDDILLMALGVVASIADAAPWSSYGPDCDNEECFFCSTDRGEEPPHAPTCPWEAARTVKRVAADWLATHG